MNNSISEYRIIIPQNASSSVRTAACELRDYIERICSHSLPIVSDSETPTELEIVVGFTNRSPDGEFDIDKLGNDGFVIETVGKKLFIVGSDKRGALYGVYTFLEKYIGCRFFAADCEIIPSMEELVLPTVERDEQIPIFEYRDIDFRSSRKGNFQAKLKANGRYCPCDTEHGGKTVYSGGFVHTLESMVPEEPYLKTNPEFFALNPDGTRQSGWGAQLCMTNPELLEFVKGKVRAILENDPDADIISISQADTADGMYPCMCPACRAVYEEEGAYSGAMIRFVNAIADEFREEYPSVKFDTLAYRHTRGVCKTAPRDNVIVRLCTIECCFSHPLGTCEDVYAVAGGKTDIAGDIAAWSSICKNIYIWDYSTNYKESNTFFPNFSVLLPNVKFFADHNARGVYEEGNYYSETCDFPELRCYVMAKLLWNPHMTEEEFNYHINDFLRGYYGDGWRNIREFIELAQSLVRDKHFGIYEKFSQSAFAPTVKKNSEADAVVASLTFDMLKNYESIDWSRIIGYGRTVEDGILTQRGAELFAAARALASDAQKEHLEKTGLLIELMQSHRASLVYGKAAIAEEISSLVGDLLCRDSEAMKLSQPERDAMASEIGNYVAEKYSADYAMRNAELRDKLLRFEITRLGEVGPYLNRDDRKPKLRNTPYAW